ncbi:hypothetical protein [Antrihabitans cavernicola]|uniref:Uncharacterized protein n=1 Tax=Antrihabitans cavernicola TaxID=2495913 RepID=A0A5A7S7I2_9NOCA|nr:hypothetical protein [Spelaeibacter cavernicola]KAA0021856.1 hypothetical protein FOY51_15780 [Spelaeibacter cavernicola]
MKGWIMGGSHPHDYHVEKIDEMLGGKPVARLEFGGDKVIGFGTMTQVVKSNRYAGKRMRLSASLRANAIEGWAGLWMRIDRAHGGMLGFDNMQDRALTGSSGWRRVEIVLDVDATEAQAIAFGVLLSGCGAVDISDIRFEEVGKDVPTTDSAITEPVNLDFTED